MKRSKLMSLTGLSVVIVLFFSMKAVFAAPSWLPSNVTIAGYEMAWEKNVSFYDINDPEKNATLYAQLWLKNDTTTNKTNIIAASMLDTGGKVFSKSAALGNSLAANLFKPAIYAMLNVTEAEYNEQFHTIWDILVYLAIQMGNSSYNLNVTEITVSNMDKALLFEDTGSGTMFNYFLFGYRGDRILGVFSISIQTQWLVWLSQLTVYNDTIAQTFETAFLWIMNSWMIMFTSFASLFNQIQQSSAPAPEQSSISLAGLESTETDEDYQEVVSFASSWGEIVGGSSIPGYDILIIAVASAASTAGIIGLKLKKHEKH
ncbi:MAG: hypothetical protein ACTSVI_07410 [Promethearchaeota archaeon]